MFLIPTASRINVRAFYMASLLPIKCTGALFPIADVSTWISPVPLLFMGFFFFYQCLPVSLFVWKDLRWSLSFDHCGTLLLWDGLIGIFRWWYGSGFFLGLDIFLFKNFVHYKLAVLLLLWPGIHAHWAFNAGIILLKGELTKFEKLLSEEDIKTIIFISFITLTWLQLHVPPPASGVDGGLSRLVLFFLFEDGGCCNFLGLGMWS